MGFVYKAYSTLDEAENKVRGLCIRLICCLLFIFVVIFFWFVMFFVTGIVFPIFVSYHQAIEEQEFLEQRSIDESVKRYNTITDQVSLF